MDRKLECIITTQTLGDILDRSVTVCNKSDSKVKSVMFYTLIPKHMLLLAITVALVVHRNSIMIIVVVTITSNNSISLITVPK